MTDPSTRAQVITRRSYNRPKNVEGTQFESWPETVLRVIEHQRWLWERVGTPYQEELDALARLFLERKALPAGRTLWLGGTSVAQKREASQFNCSHIVVETVHDVVDVLWLLLQGCGVGFTPKPGTLSGFTRPIEDVQIVRSTRDNKGRETNLEFVDGSTWHIGIGDSAEAWAKSIGKLLAGKAPVDTLVLDFSEIRPAGERLAGYGWISSGDHQIVKAYEAIVGILNRRAGQLLTRIDILDLVNWLGTILSSRRSAEIALVPYGDPEWRAFATAKNRYWEHNPQRAQSNNSLVFWEKPTKRTLTEIVDMMIEAGGSEPGFINGNAAIERAPWFQGVNPCAEILLGNRSFCNLVEVNVAAFNSMHELENAIYLIARANYRQTCVDLDDGILQRAWHENNEYLRLCGVGLTGLVRRNDLTGYRLRRLRYSAVAGAYSMADQLGLPRPKNVTTVKPSGTLSKIMDTTEGVHKPLGEYILNNVVFSKHDPIVGKLRNANYRVFDHPFDQEAVLATLPASWSDVEFDRIAGKSVNVESAVSQLDRYKNLMDNYVDQNCSITVSYDPSERKSIIDWIDRNWDSYVGVSWLFRNDPTKTAEDLGFPYLPQQVATREEYEAYITDLKDVDLDDQGSMETPLDNECATGTCPIR